MTVLIDYVYRVIAILIAITLHEYIKALTSTRLGDPKPRRDGRLTLNPLKHFEIIGFIFMLGFGYGWGKPTETTATYYEDRKKGTIITYTMPSLFNLLIATTFLLLFKVIIISASRYIASQTDPTQVTFVLEAFSQVASLVRHIASYNFALAIFNVIPIYPLDGAKILSVFLKPAAALKMSYYEKIFVVVLVGLVTFGIVDAVFEPFVKAFFSLI